VKNPNQTTKFDGKGFLKTVSRSPGVYLMVDRDGKCLYVGKAKNLRRRLGSYFRQGNLNGKIKLMMSQVADIEIRVTRTESEALLLENDLIKEKTPRYNVVFRDDKTYPYIRVSTHHRRPGVSFYRGSLKKPGTFFGPYSSITAVREILSQLQKVIPVRHCSDSYFNNRSRPCLQYQIKRCSGPCVDLVESEIYAEDVRQVLLLLEGRNDSLAKLFTTKMERAASILDYETAADYRNRISALRDIQSSQQYIFPHDREIDVVTAIERHGTISVCVMFIRNGQNRGERHYFFRPLLGQSSKQVLTAFLPQFYFRNLVPKEIVVEPLPESVDTLIDLFTEKGGRKVAIKSNVRGRRAQALALARNQAENYLTSYFATKENYEHRFASLCRDLRAEQGARRIECYDISHTGGEAVVASQVVFNREGPMISEYRQFNIKEALPGDDYGALREVLSRRFRKISEGQGVTPDILLIDGGKGQLRIAQETIETLVPNELCLAAIAKGVGRKPSLDQVYGYRNNRMSILQVNRTSLHLIQEIRDEAHRFAIAGHRRRRSKVRTESPLQQISGVGSKRRQALLRYFGGLRAIERASIDELSRVSGISIHLANRIYQHFHY
jgi:excinuclease ABC subunit C